MKSKAIVLLSGGMDSAVCAAIARKEFNEVIALNMFYGQKHSVERQCARRLVQKLGLNGYQEMDLTSVFTHMKSSLLALSGIEIDDAQPKDQIGATYVPGRNIIFLAIAAGIVDSIGASAVYIGAHSEDHGGYPDCRVAFIDSMTHAIQHGTVSGVKIIAPFLLLRKADIVREGVRLGVPFEETHSCYRGERPACGTCPTCQLRLEAFKSAGYKDPLPYKTVEGGV